MSSRSATPTGRTILVADDDAGIRTMIARALQQKYAVFEAEDGLKALLLVEEGLVPDLFILDIMMPKVDGLTVAKRLKASKEHHGTPIIFLTAKGSAKDIIEGIQAGARHYLTKPFKMSTLLAKVEKILP